jgi:Ca2+-binding EF-hand superfamily protein
VDINEVLKSCINEIWGEYDTDNSGVLEKPETKIFVTDILGSLGINGGMFSDHDFETCFNETDEDGNGVISKSEMRQFVKNVAGL